MDNLIMKTPMSTQKIIIQKDIMNSAETNFSGQIENNSHIRRIRKAKQVKDLGFEEKQMKKKKIRKKDNEIVSIVVKTNKQKEICQKIFKVLKEKDLCLKFPLFNKIDKLLKLNKYKNHQELAVDIRDIFNNYFTSIVNNPKVYSEAVELSQNFEEIYKVFENKIFRKKSRNVLELKKKMNQIRKEIRERSTSNQTPKNNKLRVDINDYNLFSDKGKRRSNKHKMSLVNNIRNLNSDQIQGIISIIHDNLRIDNKTLEFDVNNLSKEKLKELDRYVKKCLKSKFSLEKINNQKRPSIQKFSDTTLTKPGDNISVNININNNFTVGNFKIQNSFVSNTNNIGINNDVYIRLKQRNSILSDSDSLSSEDESDSESISSLSLKKKIVRDK